jgi:hypothetical protein
MSQTSEERMTGPSGESKMCKGPVAGKSKRWELLLFLKGEGLT